MAVSSYGAAPSRPAKSALNKDLDRGLEGRDVIIVEDIVDTGMTLSYLQEILRAREPKSLETACLLSKPSRRKVDVPVEYIGFTIEDRFVVGYGLDFDERFRHLPYIAVVRRGRVGGHPASSVSISESDARQIEPGSTVELEKGGHVTPLAWDTLRGAAGDGGACRDDGRERFPRISRPSLRSRAWRSASDHTGLALKAALVDHLRKQGKAVVDAGTDSTDRSGLSRHRGARWARRSFGARPTPAS